MSLILMQILLKEAERRGMTREGKSPFASPIRPKPLSPTFTIVRCLALSLKLQQGARRLLQYGRCSASAPHAGTDAHAPSRKEPRAASMMQKTVNQLYHLKVYVYFSLRISNI
jgi:hypothetical protein